jgi:hypothetical protein
LPSVSSEKREGVFEFKVSIGQQREGQHTYEVEGTVTASLDTARAEVGDLSSSLLAVVGVGDSELLACHNVSASVPVTSQRKTHRTWHRQRTKRWEEQQCSQS